MKISKNVISIIAFICGILGILLSFTVAGVIPAVTGLCLSIFCTVKEYGKNGLNRAALITSCAGLILYIIFFIQIYQHLG